MEYNLDHRVVLSTEREHKSLYSWSIKEFDAHGKQIGHDQIPWDWSVAFEVLELSTSYTLEMKKDDGAHDTDAPLSSEVREYLYGRLRPSVERREAGFYSMFGTRRRIDRFSFFIYKAKDDKNEYCQLSGSASYTAEWDFEDVTEPDWIQLSIVVSPERFEQLMNLVKLPAATGATIRLRGVDGFYSEWSPSIRTESIKVLASVQDQQLMNSENLDLVPPVLGNVQEFELSLRKQHPLIRSLKPKDGED
ncbi:hypothetical protein [Bradyrhizobium sp.]|uniref:hypothetical protein n=1 Tax=Bradyrhizobium sp. TaxID=376 RepID=UPI002621152E|nr:hypothetical protein [Bradyrhizobium sp.]